MRTWGTRRSQGRKEGARKGLRKRSRQSAIAKILGLCDRPSGADTERAFCPPTDASSSAVTVRKIVADTGASHPEQKTASAGAIQISRTKTATGVRLPGRRHHSGRWSGLASCHCRVVRGRRTARSRCAGALDSWTILILAFSAGPHQAGGSGLFQFEGPRHELESTIVDRCPTDRPRRRYRPLTAEIAHQPGNNHRPIDR